MINIKEKKFKTFDKNKVVFTKKVVTENKSFYQN